MIDSCITPLSATFVLLCGEQFSWVKETTVSRENNGHTVGKLTILVNWNQKHTTHAVQNCDRVVLLLWPIGQHFYIFFTIQTEFFFLFQKMQLNLVMKLVYNLSLCKLIEDLFINLSFKLCFFITRRMRGVQIVTIQKDLHRVYEYKTVHHYDEFMHSYDETLHTLSSIEFQFCLNQLQLFK